MWLIGVGALAVVGIGSAVVPFTPLLAVEKVTVIGTQILEASTVEGALDAVINQPLAFVNADTIRGALSTFPEVESYALEARPPHGLIVRVIERTPIGAVASGSGYSVIDAAGVVLSRSSTVPEGQPLLDINRGNRVVVEGVGRVIRSLPEAVRGQLAAATATTRDDVTLTLTSGAVVVWGNAEQSAYKAKVLTRLLSSFPGYSAYDVSAPNVASVR